MHACSDNVWPALDNSIIELIFTAPRATDQVDHDPLAIGYPWMS